MNSYEKINEWLNQVCEGLGEVYTELAKNASEILSMIWDGVYNALPKQFKKPRLPRKLKKEYKKLGIYEEWKKENNLI